MNTQLPLGVHPLTVPVREGLVVAFLLLAGKSRCSRKHIVVRYGRIVSCLNGNVVVEDITTPGSRYNRGREHVYEAHADAGLSGWS